MIRLLETQMVDGVARNFGETIETDAFTESVLIAHGKAKEVESTPSLFKSDSFEKESN
jgi:hypothetical protein